ncbi:hypothetical protein Niako_0150 [Niastella koreensis GR20-10]|uniref:Uncharacterized protein n=1 Tax=Niastella koreensis (strain DSM 17620 / KACC 11465 / NBRC 106392 / GR20-10) TaxID=700598 RepID=G8TLI1_NIAKG|nr:hypothetical protein [Niastella koreensis]AEV96550.1 hypothetical protein Niako_0150 [Niastella koreensis GR20-10]
MQHLLLAISVITLMLIAGNGREKKSFENSRVSMKMKKPAIKNVENELPADKPSVFFSRFDMVVY